jgi:nucleolar complex protein 2
MDAISESNYENLVHFFQSPSELVLCVLPFKVYAKKLAIVCARATAMYSRVDKTALLTAFATLRQLVHASNDKALFETVMKKLYNEFTRESKIGGGGYLVQDRLRICQNCIVDLLDYNKSIGYQLGFQYIRQLCLHLRTIRNNLTQESVKNIYSWQFYNCMKVWVLALTTASASDLILLVHPLVQLIVGVIRLTTNIKYFPFHLKCFELLTLINAKTGQFVPAAQYLMYPFDTVNYNFFNSKPKPLEEKMIPDSMVSLKIAKKHLPT